MTRPLPAESGGRPLPGERPFAPYRATTRLWRSVRRRHTPYLTPAATPCAPLIATTRSCARHGPRSSRLSPPCAAPRSRYAPLLGETRRTGDDYNDYANYIVFRKVVFIFGFFHGRFAVLSTNLPRTFHDVPKTGAICGIAYHLAKSRRFTEIFPEVRPRFIEIFRYTENTRTFLKLR